MAQYGGTATVNTAVFPDGFKTAGQHEPIYDLLQPFDKFPKEITGPTVWTPKDYESSPEKWTHSFTAEENAEIGAAADHFIAEGHPLTGITKVGYDLDRLVTASDLT